MIWGETWCYFFLPSFFSLKKGVSSIKSLNVFLSLSFTFFLLLWEQMRGSRFIPNLKKMWGMVQVAGRRTYPGLHASPKSLSINFPCCCCCCSPTLLLAPARSFVSGSKKNCRSIQIKFYVSNQTKSSPIPPILMSK